ncbi:GCN5-related N-acetyltransferase [Rippkaea orientalis PCC 8801]|uniref:GCN5-related N-acetyltransferase n=1 Tax=Rippkaea orientalis (strain PCC 8801 / RF-1) TaxID=41431 RepID=B7K058_RIPO1|nr:GNAT family N-acetyltransferase [Rippkaea orientalis]ACK66205.1 GCN5-related N-acetyltransferase [Rippkaea orientalis PCC 8801]
MFSYYKDYLIRDWKESDRLDAAKVIETVLKEYGLPWQPEEADQDVLAIEQFYLAVEGEFWVVEHQSEIVGTAAYYPILKGNNAVEIRKMYLLPQVRGKGLGKYLLKALETTIKDRGYQEIFIETASLLKEAVKLYEDYGYQPITEVETKRCDRAYIKGL